MSHEPPRVVFPGPKVTIGNTANQSSRRTGGNPRRVVAFILGVLFLLVFLCGGGLFLTYRRFNADSNFGGKFKDLREPIGGTIPDKTRDAIQRPIAADDSDADADEVKDWLQNDFPEVDKSRMVMEMQRSGLSNVAINPLTRSLWSFGLDDALEPPDLGDGVAVLDFEWTVKDKEARAVVAAFSSYSDESYVYVLYLNRRGEQWTLFDWRDVLQPMSEAQYWAIYAGLNEPQDETHQDFINTAYEIYCSASPTTDRINHTIATYKKTKFPHEYSVLAQDTLCEWLVTYKAKEELAEYSKQLSADDFAGAWLYKARSAAWANDIELAFAHLGALNKQVGWHPAAGRLAAEIAETPEQKHVAAEWLEREVQLAPVSSSILQQFFELADRQQANALFQKIAKGKKPETTAIELIESLYFPEERQIQYLVEVVEPIAELPETKQYLDLMLAGAKEDYGKVLALAPKVLQLESLSNSDDSLSHANLWQDYLNAAVQSNALTRAFEETPDRDKLLYQLREQISHNEPSLPAKEAIAILKSISESSRLHEDVQTQIAIAKMEIKEGHAVAAFDFLLPIYKRNKHELTDGDALQVVYPLLSTLGAAALKSERWRELTDVLEAEELLLLLGWSRDVTSKQLKEILDWYEGFENQPAFWSKYFRARSAFENGDWPTADHLMVEAIQLFKQDERNLEDSSLVSMLLDFHETDGFDRFDGNLASFWSGLRMAYAARCDALDRLISQAQVADELDEDCVAKIADHYSQASIESQERIASLLKASPLEKSQSLARDIHSHLLIVRGQFPEAFDDQLKRSRELERGSYEQRTALTAAGKQLLMSVNQRSIEPLKQVSRGTEMEAYVDCVSATTERDITGLCAALKCWEATEWDYQQFVDINVLKRLEGVDNLRAVFDAQPLDLDAIAPAEGFCRIVLSDEPEKAAKAFENYLASRRLNFYVLDAARFDQASAAIELRTMDESLVFTFEPTNESSFISSPLTESFSKEARTMVTCSPKSSDMGDCEARRVAMRTHLNASLAGLPSAVALYDARALSLFYGTGWQERFGQSLHTGIDLVHPKECFGILAPKKMQALVDRNGQSHVAFGEARELIPVNLQPQTSPWLGELGVTLAPSILVPCLPAHAVVRIER